MSDQDAITIQNLLLYLNNGWDELQAFLGELPQEWLTVPQDEQGWTIKDHLIHLAVWERGITALLQKQPRWEAMGLSREQFINGDIDDSNAIIQQQHKDMPPEEVLAELENVHQSLIEIVRGLDDEDIRLPYSAYASDSDRDTMVVAYIGGNSFGHFAEHIPWMQEIAESHQPEN